MSLQIAYRSEVHGFLGHPQMLGWGSCPTGLVIQWNYAGTEYRVADYLFELKTPSSDVRVHFDRDMFANWNTITSAPSNMSKAHIEYAKQDAACFSYNYAFTTDSGYVDSVHGGLSAQCKNSIYFDVDHEETGEQAAIDLAKVYRDFEFGEWVPANPPGKWVAALTYMPYGEFDEFGEPAVRTDEAEITHPFPMYVDPKITKPNPDSAEEQWLRFNFPLIIEGEMLPEADRVKEFEIELQLMADWEGFHSHWYVPYYATVSVLDIRKDGSTALIGAHLSTSLWGGNPSLGSRAARVLVGIWEIGIDGSLVLLKGPQDLNQKSPCAQGNEYGDAENCFNIASSQEVWLPTFRDVELRTERYFYAEEELGVVVEKHVDFSVSLVQGTQQADLQPYIDLDYYNRPELPMWVMEPGSAIISWERGEPPIYVTEESVEPLNLSSVEGYEDYLRVYRWLKYRRMPGRAWEVTLNEELLTGDPVAVDAAVMPMVNNSWMSANYPHVPNAIMIRYPSGFSDLTFASTRVVTAFYHPVENPEEGAPTDTVEYTTLEIEYSLSGSCDRIPSGGTLDYPAVKGYLFMRDLPVRYDSGLPENERWHTLPPPHRTESQVTPPEESEFPSEQRWYNPPDHNFCEPYEVAPWIDLGLDDTFEWLNIDVGDYQGVLTGSGTVKLKSIAKETVINLSGSGTYNLVKQGNVSFYLQKEFPYEEDIDPDGLKTAATLFGYRLNYRPLGYTLTHDIDWSISWEGIGGIPEIPEGSIPITVNVVDDYELPLSGGDPDPLDEYGRKSIPREWIAVYDENDQFLGHLYSHYYYYMHLAWDRFLKLEPQQDSEGGVFPAKRLLYDATQRGPFLSVGADFAMENVAWDFAGSIDSVFVLDSYENQPPETRDCLSIFVDVFGGNNAQLSVYDGRPGNTSNPGQSRLITSPVHTKGGIKGAWRYRDTKPDILSWQTQTAGGYPLAEGTRMPWEAYMCGSYNPVSGILVHGMNSPVHWRGDLRAPWPGSWPSIVYDYTFFQPEFVDTGSPEPPE